MKNYGDEENATENGNETEPTFKTTTPNRDKTNTTKADE